MTIERYYDDNVSKLPWLHIKVPQTGLLYAITVIFRTLEY